MSNGIGVIILCYITVFSIITTVIFFAADFRHFNVIEKQCAERGYIQNNDVRIMCKPENLK